jgi:hypothetical protein
MDGQPPVKTLTASDIYLNFLRNRLETNPLVPLFRGFRAAIHFGPWRAIPQYLIRRFRPVAQADANKASLLDPLDVKAVAKDIRENSVVVAGPLPQEFVNRLRKITDRLPPDQYELMHYIDEDVHLLSEDPAIKGVLRAYFGCEPVLLESNLLVTKSHPVHERAQGQNLFHFDYAGWESLNVFVYLTDVTLESAHHVVIEGSHRGISLRDMARGWLSDEEAGRRFPSAIRPITGPAGTLFFENTEAFHKRHPGTDRRVMLNLLYASHRSWLSHGRTSRRHIEYRAAQYARLRSELAM